MKHLFQLQVRNRDLRAQLGLDDGAGPEVDEQLDNHVSKLQVAVAQNYSLRAQQQSVDQELASTTAILTQEQHLIVIDDESKPTIPRASGGLKDPAESEFRATAVIAEIQAATRANIELISEFDQHIKSLEAELLDVRRQAAARPSDREAGLDARARADLEEACQRLQLQGKDLSILEQEIEGLQQSLDEKKHQVQTDQPDPRALQTQEEISQLKQSISQEQTAMEEQRMSLRQELQVLEEDLQITRMTKLTAEQEIGEMRKAQEDLAALERRLPDEQLLKESLQKELSRCSSRVDICDEKIQRLSDEAKDVRARAALVLQAAPDVAGGRSPRAAKAVDLEATVRRREEELQLARSAEQTFRRELDEAQEALQIAKVDAAVTEQKMRLLRSRSLWARG